MRAVCEPLGRKSPACLLSKGEQVYVTKQMQPCIGFNNPMECLAALEGMYLSDIWASVSKGPL